MSSLVRSTVVGALPVTICLAVIAAAAAPRESVTLLFAEANSLYQKGEYTNAERFYLQLLDKGIDSGALFYNLGNACFKQKKLGEAIYYWKKTLQKLPGDPDARENLDLAGLLVVDRIEVPADPVPLRWMDGLVHRLTMGQDGWIAVLLFAAANVFFAAYLMSGRPKWATRALIVSFATAFLALLFGCSFAWKVYERNYRLEGVVVEQKADVRSGPGTENVTVFTIHEGILLRIRGETEGWYQVSLPNGWSGWLPRSSVRVL
jgi:tetratricopeptide (TPR) repeat protein